MSDTTKLEAVAKWVISENARGVSAFPAYMAKMAKEALGDESPTPKYTSGVRVRKLKSISITSRE